MERLSAMIAVLEAAKNVNSTQEYLFVGRRAAGLVGLSDSFRSLEEVSEAIEAVELRVNTAVRTLELFA